jgi:hypothetical protein
MARCPTLGPISIARTHTARRDNAQALLERFLQLSEALKDARGKGDALMFLGKLASERSGAVTPRSPDHPHKKRSLAPKNARPKKNARLPLQIWTPRRSTTRRRCSCPAPATGRQTPTRCVAAINPLLPRPVRPTLRQRRLFPALRGVASRYPLLSCEGGPARPALTEILPMPRLCSCHEIDFQEQAWHR